MIARRLLKTTAARTAHWTRADQLIRVVAGSSRTPLVLGYHRVVEDLKGVAKESLPAMLISRRMLERHLDWIGRRFRFVSLDELGSRLEQGQESAKPVAAVTFDDGYADVYDNAFPILKKKGIPAAFFVVTDLVGTSRPYVHDELYFLLTRAFSVWRSAPRDLARVLGGLGIRPVDVKRLHAAARSPYSALRWILLALAQAEICRLIDALAAELEISDSTLPGSCALSWEMLVDLHRAGMTIGSHTKTHALLTNESLAKAADETAGSRRILEVNLGITVSHFAYPDGQFNAATVRSVAASGYRFGYACCAHRDREYPWLTIPRRLLWENSCLDAAGRFSPAVMSCAVNGVLDLLNGCRENHG